MSNVIGDSDQIDDGPQYVYVNENIADNSAVKYRHRFGVSFALKNNISSRVISSGIKWISCEEMSGSKLTKTQHVNDSKLVKKLSYNEMNMHN